MLPVDVHHLRLFLHVLAAAVWVGGQLVLAGLLPALRRLGPEATRAVAHQFERVAWPGFGLLVLSGIWNVVEIDVGDTSTAYQMTLLVKLLLVALTGIGAAVHRRSASKVALAVGGAATAIGAVGALFVGIQLHG
jgi:putative copper export protein